MSDQLVKRVVPPDVLTQVKQAAGKIEQAGGVQSTGLTKYRLGLPQRLWKRAYHLGSNCWTSRERLAALNIERVERRLAADAAARGRVEVALQPEQVEVNPRPQRHRHDVEPLLRLFRFVETVGDIEDVVAAGDDAFTSEKAGRQLEVIARRAHRNRDALAPGDVVFIPEEPDLERLFGGQHVVIRLPATVLYPDDAVGYLGRRVTDYHQSPRSHHHRPGHSAQPSPVRCRSYRPGSGRTASRSVP